MAIHKQKLHISRSQPHDNISELNVLCDLRGTMKYFSHIQPSHTIYNFQDQNFRIGYLLKSLINRLRAGVDIAYSNEISLFAEFYQIYGKKEN